MKFMILVKADKNTEAGVLPDEKLCCIFIVSDTRKDVYV
jgi:hypothetical protein